MPHSPAPWHGIGRIITATDTGTIAVLERHNPNLVADRRLMVAAPKMLATLLLIKHVDPNHAEINAINDALNAALGPKP